MPCFTIKKTSINLATMDLDVLEDGLKTAGFDVRRQGTQLTFARKGSYEYHSYVNGLLTVSGENAEALTGEVKRAYAAGAVRKAASAFGFKLTTKDNRSFVAVKRG